MVSIGSYCKTTENLTEIFGSLLQKYLTPHIFKEGVQYILTYCYILQYIWACFIGYLSKKFDDSISLLKSKLFNKNHQNKNTMKYEKKKYMFTRVFFIFLFECEKDILQIFSLHTHATLRNCRHPLFDMTDSFFPLSLKNLWKIIPFADKNRTNKK